MDKFIESFAEKSPAQKIFITLGISATLLLIIALSYFFTTPGSKDATEVVSKNLPTPTTVVVNTQTQPNSTWPIHEETTYKISFPKELKANSGVIDSGNGGTALSLEGTEEAISYNIEVQVTPSSLTPAENIYAIFRGFKFSERVDSTGGVTSRKFVGRKGDYQETVVVLENRGKVYKFQLIYTASGPNEKIEQVFESVISTFELI